MSCSIYICSVAKKNREYDWQFLIENVLILIIKNAVMFLNKKNHKNDGLLFLLQIDLIYLFIKFAFINIDFINASCWSKTSWMKVNFAFTYMYVFNILPASVWTLPSLLDFPLKLGDNRATRTTACQNNLSLVYKHRKIQLLMFNQQNTRKQNNILALTSLLS